MKQIKIYEEKSPTALKIAKIEDTPAEKLGGKKSKILDDLKDKLEKEKEAPSEDPNIAKIKELEDKISIETKKYNTLITNTNKELKLQRELTDSLAEMGDSNGKNSYCQNYITKIRYKDAIKIKQAILSMPIDPDTKLKLKNEIEDMNSSIEKAEEQESKGKEDLKKDDKLNAKVQVALKDEVEEVEDPKKGSELTSEEKLKAAEDELANADTSEKRNEIRKKIEDLKVKVKEDAQKDVQKDPIEVEQTDEEKLAKAKEDLKKSTDEEEKKKLEDVIKSSEEEIKKKSEDLTTDEKDEKLKRMKSEISDLTNLVDEIKTSINDSTTSPDDIDSLKKELEKTQTLLSQRRELLTTLSEE